MMMNWLHLPIVRPPMIPTLKNNTLPSPPGPARSSFEAPKLVPGASPLATLAIRSSEYEINELSK
jgi:hypothetical protein